MNTTKAMLAALTISAGLLTATSANAALELTLYHDGEYRGVYDTDLNITWMRNANLSATLTFGLEQTGLSLPYGYMSWLTAQNWITGLNNSNYLGYNDWRLPTSDTCRGFNCTGSEMGHLFYNELGGSLSSGDHDLGLFQNIQNLYWSDTYADLDHAWSFRMFNGDQSTFNIGDNGLYVWAVRPGGAPVSAVPEPETYAMLLAGLGLLGFSARRRRQGG